MLVANWFRVTSTRPDGWELHGRSWNFFRKQIENRGCFFHWMTFLSWFRSRIYQAFENLIPGTTYYHHHYYHYSNTSSAGYRIYLRWKEKQKTLVPNLNGEKNMLVSSVCSLFFINNLQRPRINMSFEGGAGFTRLYSPYLHIPVPKKVSTTFPGGQKGFQLFCPIPVCNNCSYGPKYQL